jgi:hypothetical protein
LAGNVYGIWIKKKRERVHGAWKKRKESQATTAQGQHGTISSGGQRKMRAQGIRNDASKAPGHEVLHVPETVHQ